jgi:hypothetical protein
MTFTVTGWIRDRLGNTLETQPSDTHPTTPARCRPGNTVAAVKSTIRTRKPRQ